MLKVTFYVNPKPEEEEPIIQVWRKIEQLDWVVDSDQWPVKVTDVGDKPEVVQ